MKKLWKENIEKHPALIYQEENPGENFIDVSNDILEWDKADRLMDWSRRRDIMKGLFYAEARPNLSNFNSMSEEKQIIGYKYFFIPYNMRRLFISEAEDSLNGEFLLSQTKTSRNNCYEAMRRHVWNYYVRPGILTLEDSQQFYFDLNYDNKVQSFIEVNYYTFKDWIFGTGNYINVFTSKSYYSEDLQNDLMRIYNGDY